MAIYGVGGMSLGMPKIRCHRCVDRGYLITRNPDDKVPCPRCKPKEREVWELQRVIEMTQAKEK